MDKVYAMVQHTVMNVIPLLKFCAKCHVISVTKHIYQCHTYGLI
jgi:hypothetical protein